MNFLIAVLVFGIIVLIHEFGHFIAARSCGVLVEEFAIGMGPKLLSRKKNDTVYSIRAFPIGGFCKMLGDEEESSDERAFNNKTVLQRIWIISAGVVMNFLLAFVIMSTLVLFSSFSTTTVKDISGGLPAEAAGVLPGDRIVSMNNQKIRISQDLFYFLYENKDKPVTVTFLRDRKTYDAYIEPLFNGERYIIGVGLDARTAFFGESVEGIRRAGFFESLHNSTWSIALLVKSTMVGMARLLTFNISLDEISGPIGMYTIIGDTFEESIGVSVSVALMTMANLVALLSANLGVFNLLPIPALDGGRLVFLLLEAVRRKPIKAEIEGTIHFAGFVLLIIFAVFIATSDIIKIW